MRSKAFPLVGLFVLGSCSDSRQDVRIASDAAGVQRTSRTYQVQGRERSPGKELERSDEHFASRPTSEKASTAFHMRLSSPFGSVREYAELVDRGADPVERVARLQEASDDLADFLLAWFEGELAAEPYWPDWRTFIDGKLRHAIKSCALTLWARPVESADLDVHVGEMLVALQLHVSRLGLCTPEEAAVLASSFTKGSGRPRELLRSRWAGDPPRALGFLFSSSSIQASLVRFSHREVWTTLRERFLKRPAYERLRELVRKADDPQDRETHPHQFVGKLVEELMPMAPFFFGGLRSVELTQLCPGELLYTNGVFDSAASAIRYGPALGDQGPPRTCYSMWVEADNAWQTAHFGRTFLTGEELAEHVMWYAGLDESERKACDEWMDRITPEQAQKRQVGHADSIGLTSEQYQTLETWRGRLIRALKTD